MVYLSIYYYLKIFQVHYDQLDPARSIHLSPLLDEVVATEDMVHIRQDYCRIKDCIRSTINFRYSIPLTKSILIFQVHYDQLDPRPFHPPVPAARRGGGYRGYGPYTSGLLQDKGLH